MVQSIVILDNLRSAHNVGAILRTCDATGVERVFLCGTTPYPRLADDARDPVIINRNTREISKTALGAETTLMLEHFNNTISALENAERLGCIIIGLEQSPQSVDLLTLAPPPQWALVLGNEPSGIAPDVLAACNVVAEIPQRGAKESLNVSVAAGIALYRLAY